MIAYSKQLFNNTLLLNEAEKLQQADFIDRKQNIFIESKLQTYHQQKNIFARIGLFLLACLLVIAICGFFALIIFSSPSESLGVLFFISVSVCFAGLELIAIRHLKYYGNGFDDALLLFGQLSLIGYISYLGDYSSENLHSIIAAVIVCSFCALRYVDRLSVILACSGLVYLVFCLFGGLFFPLFLMLLSAAMYYFYLKIRTVETVTNMYSGCLNVFYVATVLIFYAAGNYLVVRESLTRHNYGYDMEACEIPVAFLFYAYTFLCPIGFVYISLRNKNRTLLWIGLFTFAFSIYSIRRYHSLMPIEAALLMGGLLIFGLAYFAMKRLKGKTSGISFEPDRFESSEEQKNLEAISIIESYGLKPSAVNADKPLEGGGEFGGGGSGDKF